MIARAATVFVTVLGLASCGGDDTPSATTPSGPAEVVPNDSPGVTETEIKYSSFGIRTSNPLGTCVADCFDHGVKAYFEWRNSTGGIHGRKLTLAEQLDDQMRQNKDRALDIVSANDVFGAFSATLLANGWEELAHENIPLYVWAIHFKEMQGKPSIWGNAPVVCAECVNPYVTWAGTAVKATKVAAVGYGVSQNSKDCVSSAVRSVQRYGPKTGQTLAYSDDTLDYGLPNGAGPLVTAMKAAGVDFVSTCVDLNGVKTIEQEMERQGMGSVPVLHANTYDSEFIKSGEGLYEGDVVMVTFRPFEAQSAGSQLDAFKEWMGRTGKPLSEVALQGWINADLAYEGLKAAGPSFTRESVIEATNKLTAFNAGGLITPIDWSRQHEAPTDDDPVTHGPKEDCRSLVRVKDGKFELVGPADKPFACFDPASREWAEPTMKNFG